MRREKRHEWRWKEIKKGTDEEDKQNEMKEEMITIGDCGEGKKEGRRENRGEEEDKKEEWERERGKEREKERVREKRR